MGTTPQLGASPLVAFKAEGLAAGPVTRALGKKTASHLRALPSCFPEVISM